MEALARAVFLDRDGTLIRDTGHAFRPADIELLDGVAAGLRRLQQAGYCLIVVTNQAGVAKGFFKEEDVFAMHRRLREILSREGVGIADFYYCPHHPDGSVPEYARRCDCRKPEPGLILRASRERSIELRDSWLIGNGLTDVQAGQTAGCRTVLLGADADEATEDSLPPQTAVARNFAQAVEIILWSW